MIFTQMPREFVGNKVNGRISKRVFQENKTPNFPKNEYFLSGGKKCLFFGKFDVLCFLEKPILRFALLPYYRRVSTFKE